MSMSLTQRYNDTLDEIRAAGLPIDRVAFLAGDICRRELAVELEGVFA